jgi:hypothetical protein
MSNSIENIGSDIAGQMLDALFKDKEESETIDTVPLSEKKKYLRANVDSLSEPERKEIGCVLVSNGLKNSIRPCSEGSIINLDALPEIIVSQMYELMRFKISKRK